MVTLNSRPLTDLEIFTLNDLLAKRCTEEIRSFSALDGYVAAAVSSPEPVMPSEIIEDVFGEAFAWESKKKAGSFMGMILNHVNNTRKRLVNAEEGSYVPRLFREDFDHLSQWCVGYFYWVSREYDLWMDAFRFLEESRIPDEDSTEDSLEALIISATMGFTMISSVAVEQEGSMEKVQENIEAQAIIDDMLRDYHQDFRASLLSLGAGANAIHLALTQLLELVDDETDEDLLFRNESAPPVQAKSNKVGRNQPCPCGSGNKYKKCCDR